MQRLIDSEAAYRFLTDQLLKVTGKYSEGVNKGLNIARSAMRNPSAIPTIDPESLRPRGHWESPSKLLNIVNCTACKTTFPGDFDEFRYCPNCGAKMEEKTDET